MAAIWIELPFGYDEGAIKEWLTDRGLVHLKTHDQYWIKPGDGLRSASGHIARVVEKSNNEVNEPYIKVANNKLSKEEMSQYFDRTQANVPID